MRRKFFASTLTVTTLVMALLTTTACATTPSGAGQVPSGAGRVPSGAGQVPFGAADIPVSHRDRVYTADQWLNIVSVTDPVDNKLLGVILHRPKSRRCRSSGVSVFVDQPAEDAGASHPMCV